MHCRGAQGPPGTSGGQPANYSPPLSLSLLSPSLHAVFFDLLLAVNLNTQEFNTMSPPTPFRLTQIASIVNCRFSSQILSVSYFYAIDHGRQR